MGRGNSGGGEGVRCSPLWVEADGQRTGAKAEVALKSGEWSGGRLSVICRVWGLSDHEGKDGVEEMILPHFWLRTLVDSGADDRAGEMVVGWGPEFLL